MLKNLRLLYILVIILIGGNAMTACFPDDDYDASSYNDLAITAISFGTIPRIMHTTAKDGSDSTYNSTVNGSMAHPFTIDQLNNLIYNLDSLPYGVRADKIVFSTFNVADGQAALRKFDTQTDTAYTATDTLDFSHGYREFNLYGNDGTSRRLYRVEVRIHQQATDSVTWSRHTVDDFYAHHPGGEEHPTAYSADGYSFRLADGTILTSADGENYSEDAIDESEKALLPTDNYCWAYMTARADSDIAEIYLYGTTTDADVVTARMWRRLIDKAGRAEFSWEYLPTAANNNNRLPTLRNVGLYTFDDGLLLVGLDKDNKIAIRHSADRGRTWKKHTVLVLPDALKDATASTLSSSLDSDGNLWLLIDGKDVWRGRAHSVMWRKDQTSFFN